MSKKEKGKKKFLKTFFFSWGLVLIECSTKSVSNLKSDNIIKSLPWMKGNS